MHETKMGGVAIQAVTGDITKETTDVIVNSSNDKFSLKSGKSYMFIACCTAGEMLSYIFTVWVLLHIIKITDYFRFIYLHVVDCT